MLLQLCFRGNEYCLLKLLDDKTYWPSVDIAAFHLEHQSTTAKMSPLKPMYVNDPLLVGQEVFLPQDLIKCISRTYNESF